MGAHSPHTAPILNTLAKEYAVFDKYFCSIPGPTNPNRLFSRLCTSLGTVANGARDTSLKETSIFTKIREAKKTYAIYYHDGADAKGSAKYAHPWKQFGHDAKKGKLPNFSWLEPRYTYDAKTKGEVQSQHPHNGIPGGEALIKEVYEAVRNGPQWKRSMIIFTYDEHGGFYDHVPPPMTGVPNPDGKVTATGSGTFNFDRLGLRVPFVVVSPWVKKGHIEHWAQGPTKTSQYEHSSIYATMKKIFHLKGHLTKRDQWAGTFENVLLQLKKPRTDCPKKLPAVHRFPPPPSTSKRESESFDAEAYHAHLADKAQKTMVNDLQCMILEGYPEFKGDCATTTEAQANILLKQFMHDRHVKSHK